VFDKSPKLAVNIKLYQQSKGGYSSGIRDVFPTILRGKTVKIFFHIATISVGKLSSKVYIHGFKKDEDKSITLGRIVASPSRKSKEYNKIVREP
jgi:hypothetical protein